VLQYDFTYQYNFYTFSQTCLNWASVGPAFAFRINSCSVYSG
jgi:hypothetical protein